MTAAMGAASPRSRHLPGLDGLRGVAVLGVLAFHSRWSWAAGGFLGVSLFFTLSGFLITRLLVLEYGERRAIDLRSFFSRRARRLLPAAFAAIALAVAVTAAVGTPSQARDLPRDAFSSAFYVANWSFLLRGSSYATLFDAPSPLQHMWSLAIEEQLYLVVPVLLSICFAVSRRRLLGVVAAVTAGLAAVSVVSAAGGAIDTLYYGTHIRAVELLIGVLLAIAVTGPERPAPAAVSRYAGPAAMVLVLSSWSLARSSDAWLFQGPVILHALLVAMILWSVVGGVGPLARVLGWRPLEWLGRRSYGIYVYHWPLFILFDQLPSSPSRPVALALAWTATTAVAAVSYRFLEQPVRTGVVVTRPRLARSLAVAVPGVLVVAALATASTSPQISDPVVAAQRLDALTATSTTAAPVSTVKPVEVEVEVEEPTEEPAGVVQGPPLRLAVFGDSTAATTGLGLVQWSLATGSFVPVPGVNAPGCPMVARGSRYNGDQELVIAEGCDWRRSWPDTIAANDPEVIVISTGGLDSLPWSLPGVEGRFTLGDELVDGIVSAEIDAINEVAVASGARVVWLTAAPPVLPNSTTIPLRQLNRLIRAGAVKHESVDIIDFGSHVAAWPYEVDTERRSDGGHLDEDASLELAETWLGPKLLELVSEPVSDA